MEVMTLLHDRWGECFFCNDTATTEIYTLSLHDALPICSSTWRRTSSWWTSRPGASSSPTPRSTGRWATDPRRSGTSRSEEHTSELQSRHYLVCRLLLEKNNLSAFFSGHIRRH